MYSYAHESMSHTHITIHIISRLSGDMKTRQVSCSSSQQCTYVVYCLCWWVKKAQGKIRHWHNKCRPAWHAIIAQGMQKEKWLWSSTITALISWKWSMIFDNKKKGGGVVGWWGNGKIFYIFSLLFALSPPSQKSTQVWYYYDAALEPWMAIRWVEFFKGLAIAFE